MQRYNWKCASEYGRDRKGNGDWRARADAITGYGLITPRNPGQGLNIELPSNLLIRLAEGADPAVSSVALERTF